MRPGPIALLHWGWGVEIPSLCRVGGVEEPSIRAARAVSRSGFASWLAWVSFSRDRSSLE